MQPSCQRCGRVEVPPYQRLQGVRRHMKEVHATSGVCCAACVSANRVFLHRQLAEISRKKNISVYVPFLLLPPHFPPHAEEQCTTKRISQSAQSGHMTSSYGHVTWHSSIRRTAQSGNVCNQPHVKNKSSCFSFFFFPQRSWTER